MSDLIFVTVRHTRVICKSEVGFILLERICKCIHWIRNTVNGNTQIKQLENYLSIP